MINALEKEAVEDIEAVHEIGEVLVADDLGRQKEDQITVFKSVGHVANDIAAAQLAFEMMSDGELAEDTREVNA